MPRVGGNTDNAITIDDSTSEEEEVMSDDEPSLDLNSPEGKESVDVTEVRICTHYLL